MSVLPIILDGQDSTVVINEADFAFDGHAVLMRSVDRQQLNRNSTDCNVSYDLRVGERYRDHRNSDSSPLSANGEFTLLPGAAVIIQTEEEVRFPRTVFGQIVPKVSLLQQGIANTGSKVDPGYHGRLLITVFNHGKRPVTLKRGQRFCSMYLLNVGAGIRPYEKDSKQIKGDAEEKAWLKIRDWLERNIAVLIVMSILATTVLAVLSGVAIFISLIGMQVD